MNFNNITFKLSQGTEQDFLILRHIHRTAMEKSVIQSIGQWNDDFQKTRLLKHFKEAYSTLEFILLNDNCIGTINARTKVFEDGSYHFIEQFYLLPEYQGKGLGSYLLDLKIGQNQETRLSVLKKDKLTHQFYYKNGFVEYFEDEYQKYMKKINVLDAKQKINLK